MKLFYRAPIIGLSLLSILSSCSNKEEENPEPATPPKTQPAPRTPPEPQPAADPTSGFRMLDGDTQLPTDAQLSRGQKPSPISTPDTPTTSVKPPAAEE